MPREAGLNDWAAPVLLRNQIRWTIWWNWWCFEAATQSILAEVEGSIGWDTAPEAPTPSALMVTGTGALLLCSVVFVVLFSGSCAWPEGVCSCADFCSSNGVDYVCLSHVSLDRQHFLYVGGNRSSYDNVPNLLSWNFAHFSYLCLLHPVSSP